MNVNAGRKHGLNVSYGVNVEVVRRWCGMQQTQGKNIQQTIFDPVYMNKYVVADDVTIAKNKIPKLLRRIDCVFELLANIIPHRQPRLVCTLILFF